MIWNKRLQRLALMLACVMLAHCTALPPAPEQAVNWERHQARIIANQHWGFDSKLGIRSPEHSGSARLNWQQRDQDYRLQLSGPLGQGAVVINGEPGLVTLEQSGEAPISANSGEALLYEASGWHLPLEQLTAWVRGIPAPGLAITALELDEHQLLAKLIQGDWQLTYSRYGLYHDLYLPGRIVAENADTRLTLIIHQWQAQDSD
ncbi:MAG TPA: lipoprotein insertase outer membrane protein LolB [Cellvibrionaceae bacterium]